MSCKHWHKDNSNDYDIKICRAVCRAVLRTTNCCGEKDRCSYLNHYKEDVMSKLQELIDEYVVDGNKLDLRYEIEKYFVPKTNPQLQNAKDYSEKEKAFLARFADVLVQSRHLSETSREPLEATIDIFLSHWISTIFKAVKALNVEPLMEDQKKQSGSSQSETLDKV